MAAKTPKYSGRQNPQAELPLLEPQVYEGDPMYYREWSMEFKTIIESRVTDKLTRLYYLKKYTAGEARKAINGHLQVSAASSYDKAMKGLKARFGDQKLVHQAYRNKMERWEIDPEKCSGEELREFCDFLETCVMLMSGFLSDYKWLWDCHQFLLLSLLPKLPKVAHQRWCKKEKGILEGLSSLVDVVRELSDEMCVKRYIYPASPMFEEFFGKDAKKEPQYFTTRPLPTKSDEE